MKQYLLLLSLLFISVFQACKNETKSASKVNTEVALPVSIHTISIKNTADAIEASGILSSKSEIKLAFKTGGMIKNIYVKEGQFVKAGQLLAELDMSEIDAQVNQAQLGYNKAKRDYERVKKMYDEEAATATNVQDATTGMEVAAQTVNIAGFNRKLSKIYAPKSGVILRKISEAGELITPFAPAFVLGSGNSAYVVNLGLSDKQIVKVNMGDNAEITIDAYPDEKFLASVSQISQTINPSTGTYEIELELKPTAKKLMTGFSAKGVLNTKNALKKLVLPINAMVEADQTTAYVYIYDAKSQSAIKKEVKIGKLYGSDVEIISGLVPNDVVITAGSGFVKDGQKVSIQK